MSQSYRALLTPNFIRFWIGSTASGFATWGLTFLLGLAVAYGTISPQALGLLLAIRSVGFLTGVLFGGTSADRYGSRLVILIASITATIGSAATAYGIAETALTILYFGALTCGIGQGACRPAYQSLMRDVTTEAQRQPANAAMSMSLNTATFAGPTLATGLAIVAGLTPALIALGVLWALSAALPPWVAQTHSTTRQETIIESLKGGLAEALRLGWFLPILAALCITIALGYSATGVLLPVISKTTSGDGIMMAQTLTIYTLGGIIGAYITGRAQISHRLRWTMMGLAAYSLAPLSFIWADIWILPMIGFFLAGAGIHCFNVIFFTTIQAQVAPDKLARVMSVDFMCAFGLAPLGLLLITPMSEMWNIESVLLICAAACALSAALIYEFIKRRTNWQY